MARGSAITAAAAVILGILAVTLSFVAYANRIKAENVGITNGKCTYPSSPSFALGIVAALCLMFEQIILSVGTGCYCCRGNSCPKKCAGITSLILFILSWVTFVLAFISLLGSAILNNGSYLTDSHPDSSFSSINDTSDSCYLGKDNLFIGAAIWCIISIILGLISFIALKTSAKGNGNRLRGGDNLANEEGIAMAEPMTTPAARASGQY